MNEDRNAREEREIIEFLQRCASAKAPDLIPTSPFIMGLICAEAERHEAAKR